MKHWPWHGDSLDLLTLSPGPEQCHFPPAHGAVLPEGREGARLWGQMLGAGCQWEHAPRFWFPLLESVICTSPSHKASFPGPFPERPSRAPCSQGSASCLSFPVPSHPPGAAVSYPCSAPKKPIGTFFSLGACRFGGEKGAKVSGDKAGVEISTFATPPPIPSIHAQSSRALKALCPARGQNPLPRPIHASLLPAERNLPPGTQYPPSVGESEWERAVPSPRRPRGAKCRCGNGVARSRVRCCATLRVLMAFQPQRSAVI